MKTFTLLFAALASMAAAQSNYNISSKLFDLVITSGNSTLNGTVLAPCHQGAAIEGLCLGGKLSDPPAGTFYHNVSDSATSGAADTDGTLCYDLQIGSGPVPSTMRLYTSVTTNVAVAIFMPGARNPSTVSFEENGSMYIPTAFDDTVSPAVYLSYPIHIKKWYICLATWSYTYESLIWSIGVKSEPQNPACQYVEVIRVFA